MKYLFTLTIILTISCAKTEPKSERSSAVSAEQTPSNSETKEQVQQVVQLDKKEQLPQISFLNPQQKDQKVQEFLETSLSVEHAPPGAYWDLYFVSQHDGSDLRSELVMGEPATTSKLTLDLRGLNPDHYKLYIKLFDEHHNELADSESVSFEITASEE